MKSIRLLAAFGILGLTQFAVAAAPNHFLRVNVPFSFVVAGQQFSPGIYNLREDANGVVTVQGQGKAAAVISSPESMLPAGQPSSLRFTSASSTEYLSGFAVEGQGMRAIPVPTEHKLTLSR
jgi:hypothetical protein